MVSDNNYKFGMVVYLYVYKLTFLWRIHVRVFKRAARINAQRLILVGRSEWEKGMISVKILSTGEQHQVNLDDLQ